MKAPRHLKPEPRYVQTRAGCERKVRFVGKLEALQVLRRLASGQLRKTRLKA